MSGIWVVLDYRKGKRAPQAQSPVQLEACRLAKGSRAGALADNVGQA